MDFIISIFSHLDSVIAIILVLGGLIFIHELGHFLAFRSLGVGIVTFSIGMGPKIWGVKKGKTTYQIAAFPFGGYVAAVGEYSKDVEEIGFTQEEAVSNRPAWQRMYFAFAGPFANLLTAWAIYTLLAFTSGMNILLPQVGALLPDSPAMSAGLQEKDLIVAIDGKTVSSWNEVPDIVNNSGGKTMKFTIERNNENMDVLIDPQKMPRLNIFGEEEIAWLIGIQPMGTVRTEELGFAASLK
ncbi:MAG TPA: RIP metalloprotease RseP, partial [Desulfovibrio sp.]|nr:RIP metalloprotease RseP [Desulfovibrio sp.]